MNKRQDFRETQRRKVKGRKSFYLILSERMAGEYSKYPLQEVRLLLLSRDSTSLFLFTWENEKEKDGAGGGSERKRKRNRLEFIEDPTNHVGLYPGILPLLFISIKAT